MYQPVVTIERNFEQPCESTVLQKRAQCVRGKANNFAVQACYLNLPDYTVVVGEEAVRGY